MANPTSYTKSYDFAGFQANNARTPLPATELDNELDNISDAIVSNRNAIVDLRRSDGELKNEIVTYDALSAPVKAMLGTTETELNTLVDAVGTSFPAVLTDWEPDYSFRRYVTQAQWAGILSGVSTDPLSVELQEAEDDVNSKGGGIVMYPAGVIPVDGYKGAQSSYNANYKGGLYVAGKVHHKGVRGKTIWKNVVDASTCIISMRRGEDFSFEDIIFDLDWPNKTAIPGECVLFWNGVSTIRNASFRGCVVKNTGHYGFGVQSAGIVGLNITDCHGIDIGGDFIDIKEYDYAEKTDLVLSHCSARRVGINDDHDGQTAFDIRGAVRVFGCAVYELHAQPAQTSIVGFRVNSDVDSEQRRGGRRSILTNNMVFSDKDPGVGLSGDQLVTGFTITDEDVTIAGAYAEKCNYGLVISAAADSTGHRAHVTGFHAKSCRGDGDSGFGIVIGGGTTGHTLEATITDCDTGLQCNSTGCYGQFMMIDNDVNHNMNLTAMAGNNFRFLGNGSYAVANAQHNVTEELTVWGQYGGALNLRSTNDGNWTSPYSGGAVNWFSQDASTGAVGKIARIELRAVTTIGSAWGYFISGFDGTAETEIVTLRAAVTPAIWNLALVQNCADDAAASAANVPVGGMYRTGSALKIRAA